MLCFPFRNQAPDTSEDPQYLHTKNKYRISTDPQQQQQQQRATSNEQRTTNSKRVFPFCLYPDRWPSHNNPCELRVAMSSIIAQLVHWVAACFPSVLACGPQKNEKKEKALWKGKSTDIKKERKKEQASKKRGPTNSISFLPSYHGAPVN